VGERKKKFTRFIYLVFIGAIKNMEGWLNIFILFLVHSQIWLNLAMDNHHFGYKQRFPNKTLISGKNIVDKPILSNGLISMNVNF
jgi:hypothetical protein